MLPRRLETPAHELQRMGGCKTTAMIERYVHVAPGHLTHVAAVKNLILNWLESLVTGARNRNQHIILINKI